MSAYDEHVEDHGCGCLGYIALESPFWGEPCEHATHPTPVGIDYCVEAQRLIAQMTPDERAEYDARTRFDFG